MTNLEVLQFATSIKVILADKKDPSATDKVMEILDTTINAINVKEKLTSKNKKV